MGTLDLSAVFKGKEIYWNSWYMPEKSGGLLTRYEKAAKDCFKIQYESGGAFDPVVTNHTWWTGRYRVQEVAGARPIVIGLEPNDGNIDVPVDEIKPLLAVYQQPNLDWMSGMGSDLTNLTDSLVGTANGARGLKAWIEKNEGDWDGPTGSAARLFKDQHLPQIVQALDSYPNFLNSFRAVLSTTAAVLNYARGTALKLVEDAIAKFGESTEAYDRAAKDFQKNAWKGVNKAVAEAIKGSADGVGGAATGAAGGLLEGIGEATIEYHFADKGAKPHTIHEGLRNALRQLEPEIHRKTRLIAGAADAHFNAEFFGQAREQWLPLGTDR